MTALSPALFQITGLYALDLSGNRLTAVPPELGQLTELVHLDLSGNQLTALSPALGQLTELAHLDLSGNQLTALPPELAQLTDLITLNLSGNQLETIESSAQYLRSHFKELDLSDNPLTALPTRLPSSFKVDHLDLSGTALTTLPPVLQQRPLISLALRRHQLTDLAAELAGLAQGPLPPTRLDLSDNQLSGPLSELAPLPPLLSLDLRGNPLATCLLPLPWQVERYVYPPEYTYVADFYRWLLSPPPDTEPTDLPFLSLCWD